MKLLEMADGRMPDHGPLYTETLAHLYDGQQCWLVEPWNAVTAFFFVLLALFWAQRIAKAGSRQVFLWLNVVLLFVGGTGGTLYHAFRSRPLWLWMDWAPIAILCVLAAGWFYGKIFKRKVLAWLFALGDFVLISGILLFLNRIVGFGSPSRGYVLIALYVIVPIFVHLKQTALRGAGWVGSALISFAVALSFRTVDLHMGWPMGSHFLWHLFGLLAVHCLLSYVFGQVQSSLD